MMETPNRFVAIRFVTRFGYLLPLLGAAACVLGGFGLSYSLGTTLWAVLGVVAAAVAWAGLRVAVEVIDLVAETLLPR